MPLSFLEHRGMRFSTTSFACGFFPLNEFSEPLPILFTLHFRGIKNC